MRTNWEFETCACCTREQRLAWHIEDSLWGNVAIDYYKDKALCLECFLRMSDDKGTRVQMADIKLMGLVSSRDGEVNGYGEPPLICRATKKAGCKTGGTEGYLPSRPKW